MVLYAYTKPLNLIDDTAHAFMWTRNEKGEMAVSVDGSEILRVKDNRFIGDFTGFTLVNRGGDFGIRSVTISGTKAGL